jgi:hypothetical protein
MLSLRIAQLGLIVTVVLLTLTVLHHTHNSQPSDDGYYGTYRNPKATKHNASPQNHQGESIMGKVKDTVTSGLEFGSLRQYIQRNEVLYTRQREERHKSVQTYKQATAAFENKMYVPCNTFTIPVTDSPQLPMRRPVVLHPCAIHHLGSLYGNMEL